MRWGRSCGGVSRGVVEALDGEMSLLPAASFRLLSGLCRSTIGVGGAVVSVGAALSPPLILFSETAFFEARSIATNRVVVIGCGDSRALYICEDHGFVAEWSP